MQVSSSAGAESIPKLSDALGPTLIEIAEADSIAQVAKSVLETFAQWKSDASMLLRFPSHTSICRYDPATSQLRMTQLQQTLPILAQGAVQFTKLPIDVQNAIVSEWDSGRKTQQQFSLLAPQDVDGVAVYLCHHLLSGQDVNIKLLHRAAQARIVALYALDAAQQQTYTDDLTGLANRRYFVRRLAEEVDRAERHGRQLALIILDLDHLKQLNDSLGHQTGDEALREIAVRLKQSVRRIDTVCRYAGDEFCVIMPDAGAETCQALLRRLHSTLNLSKSSIDCPTGTISMGAAIFPQHANNPEFLLKSADNALRAAKKVRGTFVLADITPQSE